MRHWCTNGDVVRCAFYCAPDNLTSARRRMSMKKGAVIGLEPSAPFFGECSIMMNNGREIVKTPNAGH